MKRLENWWLSVWEIPVSEILHMFPPISSYVSPLFPILGFKGDYMIPIRREEISTRPAGKDFTLRLHGGVKFHICKAGQYYSWYLFTFIYILF